MAPVSNHLAPEVSQEIARAVEGALAAGGVWQVIVKVRDGEVIGLLREESVRLFLPPSPPGRSCHRGNPSATG